MSTPFPPPGGEPDPASGPPQPAPGPGWPSAPPSPGYGLAYVDPRHTPEPPATKTMAGWSLATSFIFCVPLLPLLGLILGIVVLVRARDGREHGSGMAVAGVTIGSLALLVQATWFVVGFVEAIQGDADPSSSSERPGASETPVLPSQTMVTKLKVGDCFDDPAVQQAGAEPVEAGVVRPRPCTERHQLEIYEIRNLLGDEWPGQAAVDKEALACFPAFREFVQVPYARSELEIIYYFPTKTSWDVMGDHSITCAVTDPSGLVSGTLTGARR